MKYLILDYLELTQKNAAEIDDRVSETLRHIREMEIKPFGRGDNFIGAEEFDDSEVSGE